MKAALTLDGKISAGRGDTRLPDTKWITSEQARAHAQTLRHAADAIVTGIGTVLADNPLLTDRTGQERSRPLLRVVLDSKLRIPLESRLVQSARDDLLVFAPSAPEAHQGDAHRREALRRLGVGVEEGGLHELMEYLTKMQMRSVLIEAGATVNASALEAGIVDKIFFYYAPKIFGGPSSLPVVGGEARARLERLTLHNIAPDEFAVEGYVHRDR
jgi:diaminohydroxyphosphoribosylaminopyrimidine deaminase/5-amino-6-(5-phosphoribosylamino)uracil reductase